MLLLQRRNFKQGERWCVGVLGDGLAVYPVQARGIYRSCETIKSPRTAVKWTSWWEKVCFFLFFFPHTDRARFLKVKEEISVSTLKAIKVKGCGKFPPWIQKKAKKSLTDHMTGFSDPAFQSA